MAIKEWVIGILSIGIFTFMLISTGIYIGINNDYDNSIMNESVINQTYNSLYTSFDDNLDSFNDSKESFEKDNPLIFGDTVFLSTIINSGKTATNVTFGTIIIISTLIEHQLGIPPIILSVIFAIILIVTVLLIWSLIKTGS